MSAMSKTTAKPTLDPATRLELRKLCWETMFGQELVKLTIMDLASSFSLYLIVIRFFRVISAKHKRAFIPKTIWIFGGWNMIELKLINTLKKRIGGFLSSQYDAHLR